MPANTRKSTPPPNTMEGVVRTIIVCEGQIVNEFNRAACYRGTCQIVSAPREGSVKGVRPADRWIGGTGGLGAGPSE